MDRPNTEMTAAVNAGLAMVNRQAAVAYLVACQVPDRVIGRLLSASAVGCDSVTRAASTSVLTARVTVDDEVLIVRAAEVASALLALCGDPKPGLMINAKVEYMSMTAAEFAAVPDYQ